MQQAGGELVRCSDEDEDDDESNNSMRTDTAAGSSDEESVVLLNGASHDMDMYNLLQPHLYVSRTRS